MGINGYTRGIARVYMGYTCDIQRVYKGIQRVYKDL